MIVKKAPMVYDKENECWRVEAWGQSFGLHCGEGLQLHLGRRVLAGRLELGRSWYVIVDEDAFGLLEGRKYTVSVNI